MCPLYNCRRRTEGWDNNLRPPGNSDPLCRDLHPGQIPPESESQVPGCQWPPASHRDTHVKTPGGVLIVLQTQAYTGERLLIVFNIFSKKLLKDDNGLELPDNHTRRLPPGTDNTLDNTLAGLNPVSQGPVTETSELMARRLGDQETSELLAPAVNRRTISESSAQSGYIALPRPR